MIRLRRGRKCMDRERQVERSGRGRERGDR